MHYRYRASSGEAIKTWFGTVIRRMRWQVLFPSSILFFLVAALFEPGRPFFLICGLLSFIIAFSGRISVLMKRANEAVDIGEECFSVSFIPFGFEHRTYNRVELRIDYLDIDRIVYEPWAGRLFLYGDYAVRFYFYRPGQGSYYVDKKHSGRIYVYQRYGQERFDHIMKWLKENSMLGIEVIEEDVPFEKKVRRFLAQFG